MLESGESAARECASRSVANTSREGLRFLDAAAFVPSTTTGQLTIRNTSSATEPNSSLAVGRRAEVASTTRSAPFAAANAVIAGAASPSTTIVSQPESLLSCNQRDTDSCAKAHACCFRTLLDSRGPNLY